VASRAAIDNTGMIIGASGKGTRAVTTSTIENIPNWNLNTHVIEFHTECGNTMARIAPGSQDSRIGMIGKRAGETLGVMAITTIGSGSRVGGYCRRLTRRINAIAIIVA
jgi:hypothetical protein